MSAGDRFRAWLYETLARPFERAHGRALRAPLLANARGRVLEIGCGTGANFAHYPETVAELVASDPSQARLERAHRVAVRAGRDVRLVRASADDLPFERGSFDTVVSTLVLCTVPDQEAALREIARVLRPGGRFVFGEHVRSNDPGLARWQDRLEGLWRVVADGCHPNRDTLAAIERSGFTVETLERGELPGAPTIVRPYVSGSAVPPGT